MVSHFFGMIISILREGKNDLWNLKSSSACRICSYRAVRLLKTCQTVQTWKAYLVQSLVWVSKSYSEIWRESLRILESTAYHVREKQLRVLENNPYIDIQPLWGGFCQASWLLKAPAFDSYKLLYWSSFMHGLIAAQTLIIFSVCHFHCFLPAKDIVYSQCA